MEESTVLWQKEGEIGIITLNRPRVLNAMNRKMWQELRNVLEDAREDPQIRVLIITGKGRAFSTGADLKESKGRTPEDYRDYLRDLQEISRQIIRFPKPTIAAINGYALGSGYELALACDIRVASEEALIGSPEARVSSSVTGGALRLLQELVGPGKARELLFTAEPIDGKEAQRIGLVNEAVPAHSLMDAAMEMAAKMAKNSPFSIELIKRGLNMARDQVSLEALMEYEVEACLATVFTRERKERLEEFEARKDR